MSYYGYGTWYHRHYPQMPYVYPRLLSRTTDAVLLKAIKLHLDLTSHTEDVKIENLANSAMEYIEKLTSRTLFLSSKQLDLPWFPHDNSPVYLISAPVTAVTSIGYMDEAGAPQTLDVGNDVSVVPVWDESTEVVPNNPWPDTLSFGDSKRRDIVNFIFDAGYGYAALPFDARQALNTLVAHWYEHPSGVITGTISKAIEHSMDGLIAGLRTGAYVGYQAAI